MSDTDTNTEKLSLAPLHVIRENLDRIYGKNTWTQWELETITETLGIPLNELLRDKIAILQALSIDPTLLLGNVLFFLHAVGVMNNKVADMDFLPMPTSLELAYGLVEARALLGDTYVAPSLGTELGEAIKYLLIEDGFSVPLPPFDFLPKEVFSEGQTAEDTKAKEVAIRSYIKHMEEL